jgi:hypothetical protein
MLELLEDGGMGYMPDKKHNGWIRLMFENWNSLGIYTQSWKIDRLNYLIKHLSIDIVAGCECQTDWSFVNPDNQFHSLLSPGRAKKGTTAHNTTERIQRDQMGGTAITGIGRICDVITEVGQDSTGLGRWSWITLHGGTTTTRIMSAYLPRKPNKHSKGRTVWEQHSRYFEAKGDMRYPSTIFINDLLRVISTWITAGDHIILSIDANQDVYSGKLAHELKREPYNMTCLLQRAMGELVPNSHFTGKGKISTIFGTPGIITGNGMCYPHWYGIGDHRVMVLEIAAYTAFEGAYPTIATPNARILSCKTKRHQEQYCKRLRSLLDEHKMERRLASIQLLDGETYSSAHNKWDNELGDYMRSAENACAHYRDGTIEFSPTVGQWLRKRSVLKWILRWHDGKVPDTRNLLRAAKRLHIDNALSLDRQDIEARLVACLDELYQLRHDAPALRLKHLRWRLSIAKSRQDEVAQLEIHRIIVTEAKKRRQRTINRAIKDPKGRPVLHIEIETPQGTQALHSREDIERQVQHNLQQRFSLGKRAPINHGSLLRDFGILGSTEATHQLFKGEYDFTSLQDSYTEEFLREATRIKQKTDTLTELPSAVTEEDFITFWRTANEFTSSSKSGRHFGHYKAICSDKQLVSLHVNSINMATTKGTPLTRWGQGVTVLLEKVAGTAKIDKLRAICLLEADFNWWLKVIFARRLIQHMTLAGVIPLEQGAVKGKTTTNNSLLKQLFFDQANILHEDCALSSTDAENCYDAVNHAACSIALQAMGIFVEFVICYLYCIQLMQYYLATGHGLSTSSYGGSQKSRCMGLVQGSGAAPGAWIAVSTVIVGAYKKKGYGAHLVGGWSQQQIPLSALLYVDDTDLLHKQENTPSSLDTLVPWVQEATNHWGHLLQATGGNLKPAKCYWYLLHYQFNNGVATLTSKKHLEQYSISIPQANGDTVNIALKDPTEASNVLGVLVSPTGDGAPMLEHMLAKGYKWSNRVRHSKLAPADAWFSFRTQAIMSVRYGLIPLMASREKIETQLSSWYYHCLPALGVNRSIGCEWKTLPFEFQGLGLPHLTLEKTADSLHLLQHHWGHNTELGRALLLSFELIQVETGLYGNFLLRDYNTLGCLASHTWFKQLWELTHHFQIKVTLSNKVIIPQIRENDKIIMEEAIKILPRQQWTSFNRARKYFKVYFLSHLLMADGSTVNPAAINPALSKHRYTAMRFPQEKPTSADLELWTHTIQKITSSTLTISPPLGKFLNECPEYLTWQTNSTKSHIVHREGDSTYKVYYRLQNIRETRRRHIFQFHHTTTHPPPCTLTASIIPLSLDTVSLHSVSTLKRNPVSPKTPFLTKLQEGAPAQLWQGMQITQGGKWILQAIENGTLLVAHDGSFMPHKHKSLCSAGIVLLCTKSGQIGTIKLCERTCPSTASNYRGELIGGMITSHILRVASLYTSSTKVTHIYCDNMGVIHHTSHPNTSTLSKQSQTDVLLVFTNNLATSNLRWQYHHVHSHLDDTSNFSDLSLPEQLNVLADNLAKEALLDALEASRFSTPLYPNEHMRLFIGNNKVTTSIKSSLYSAWGRQAARTLFDRKKIIRASLFEVVNWTGLNLAMKSLPQMFRVWVTKHVSGTVATNRHLAKMNTNIENKCYCCGRRNETPLHITRCPNKGRRLIFTQTSEALIHWMEQSYSHPEIILALCAYLKYRGRVPMKRICLDFPILKQFAIETDLLGWRNFTEARLTNTLFLIQEDWLKTIGSRLSIESWTKQFLIKILNITRRQWMYRNSRIHINHVEGLTLATHENIMNHTKSLIATDPTDLLPQHQSLLQIDYEALGKGPSIDRQYWIAQMESAITSKKRKTLNTIDDYNTSKIRR